MKIIQNKSNIKRQLFTTILAAIISSLGFGQKTMVIIRDSVSCDSLVPICVAPVVEIALSEWIDAKKATNFDNYFKGSGFRYDEPNWLFVQPGEYEFSVLTTYGVYTNKPAIVKAKVTTGNIYGISLEYESSKGSTSTYICNFENANENKNIIKSWNNYQKHLSSIKPDTKHIKCEILNCISSSPFSSSIDYSADPNGNVYFTHFKSLNLFITKLSFKENKPDWTLAIAPSKTSAKFDNCLLAADNEQIYMKTYNRLYVSTFNTLYSIPFKGGFKESKPIFALSDSIKNIYITNVIPIQGTTKLILSNQQTTWQGVSNYKTYEVNYQTNEINDLECDGVSALTNNAMYLALSESCKNPIIKIINTQTKELKEFKPIEGTINSLSFSPINSDLLIYDGANIFLLNYENGTTKQLTFYQEKNNSELFKPIWLADGTVFFSVKNDGEILYYRIKVKQ